MKVELHEQALNTERQLKAKKVPASQITEHLQRKYPECFGGKALPKRKPKPQVKRKPKPQVKRQPKAKAKK